MVTWSTRADWNARPPLNVRTDITPVGVAVHWPGGGSYRRDDHAGCLALVRSWQTQHMNAGNVNDIYYNLLACHHGHLIEGRSTQTRPVVRGGANGNATANGRWYSLQGMWGAGDGEPPDVLLATMRDGIEWFRSAGGAGDQLSVHSDHTATQCPGPALTAWARAGAPRPDQPDEENTMSWKEEIKLGISAEERARLGYTQDTYRAEQLLGGMHVQGRRVQRIWVPLILEQLGEIARLIAALPNMSDEQVAEWAAQVAARVDSVRVTVEHINNQGDQ